MPTSRPLFAERVLNEADVALLGPRADAREAFDALVASADGWGAPDPVASAMADWRFDEAVAQIDGSQARGSPIATRCSSRWRTPACPRRTASIRRIALTAAVPRPRASSSRSGTSWKPTLPPRRA